MTTWEKAMSRYWPESLPLHPIRPHVLFQHHASAGTEYTANQQWHVRASSRLCVLHFDPGFISSPCYTLVPYSAQTPDGRKVSFAACSRLSDTCAFCRKSVQRRVVSGAAGALVVRRQLVAGGGRANMWSPQHNDHHGLSHHQ